MKNGSLLTLGMFMLATLLVGCKPSTEQAARIDEQRREHVLNTIQENEVLPKIDPTKETVLKRGGKYFIAPKEYFRQGNMHGFFWPSKAPKFGGNEDYPEREAVRAGKISTVEIAFYIEARTQKIDVSALIEKQLSSGRIKTEKFRPGLERADISLDPDQPNRTDQFYIASALRTPNSSGPPAVACFPRENNGTASASFEWKPGFVVTVRMDAVHCKDWPEIYTEIIRVLNLVREA